MRDVSQVEPRPTVVVTRSVPVGWPRESTSCARTFSSFSDDVARRAHQKLALARSGSGRGRGDGRAAMPSSCSSALTCRLTADWLMSSVSPARVNEPAWAAAWKMRSLSQSIWPLWTGGPGSEVQARYSAASRVDFHAVEVFLGLERRHAA